MTDQLTIEELSKCTGVEIRTLRSWVSEGLLAPPFRPGRGARYPASNADRALAVKTLKDLRGLSLLEIGRLFMTATEEQIREWAIETGPTSAPLGSARDYLNKIRASSASVKPTQSSINSTWQKLPWSASEQGLNQASMLSGRMAHSGGSKAELASIEWLIFQLEKILGTSAPRHSRGAVWTRISVTSAFEISVRGDLKPRERILFEQLADQFRTILTGGTKNE